MRVLIVDTCYPPFLESHYRVNPALADASYEQQWRALMDTQFGTADAYSHYLRALGHEAEEVVVNCGPLQAAWAREHGLGRRARNLWRGPSSEQIFTAQARAFQPDVVYVQNLSVLPPHVLRSLGARLVVGQIASEPPAAAQLSAFDLILTSFPHFVPRFRESGIASEYLRIGFDPRVLDRLGPCERDLGVVFVGSLGRRQHGTGNEVVDALARAHAIDVWGTGIDDWPADSALRAAYRGEAWGIEMFRLFARAKVVVNRHIDVAGDYANNMRLYEATGVGSLLVTDAKRNLGELFVPGQEVVVYRDADELVDSVAWYLDHPDERTAIAHAGQQRTLAEHGYDRRMAELVTILEAHLGDRAR